MTDFGVKTIVAQIGESGPATTGNLDNIRLAQQSAWNDNGNVLAGPVLYDVNIAGPYHFVTNSELQLAANRWWVATRKDLYNGPDGRGPILAAAEYNSAKTQIRLTFTDDTLPLLPASGLTGFTVKDNGSSVSLSATTRIANNQLRITLAAAASGTLTASLGAGRTGKGATVPTDSSTFNLPAEIFIDQATTVLDQTAPTISSMVSSPNSAGATISWTTNENASSVVDYGSTSSYGTSTSETDTSPRVTNHSVSIAGLSSCTTYHFRVRSKDAESNEGTSSDNTLTTTGCGIVSAIVNAVSSTISAPSCTANTPGSKTPSLYGAIAQDGTSVLLYFTEADDPVDHYVLQFGTSSGDYPYGATDIGGKASRTFLVQSLSPNTTYYFRVRGGNGCATGNWSNEISTKTKSLLSFSSLAITSFELEPLQQEQQISKSTSNCQPLYVVKAGDSLWSIAKHQLGDATKFGEIASQNSESYPAISSGILIVGWNLKINCAEQTDLYINGTVPSSQGYEVKIKVVDKDKKAVEGAKVTLHSTPREAITDKNGVVDYENVQAGQHKVLIAYNGLSGEQSVNLTGDVKEFDLSVQVSTGNPFLNLPVLLVIGVLGTVVLILLFRLYLTRHKIL